MRSHIARGLVGLAALGLTAAGAQDAQPVQTLTLSSKLVLVPAQVQTKSGQMIYALKPEQFELLDNGVPQKIKLDEEVDSLGLSLVVVVQCSRKAYTQFDNMHGLQTLVDELTGGANDQVAMISYGTEIELLTGLTHSDDKLSKAYQNLQPCDDEADARTLDAVEYADKLFEKVPPTNRHAILLIGETRDHGSAAGAPQVVADLNRTNVVVDAVSFNPGKDETLSLLRSLLGGGPAPNPKEFLMLVVNALRRNVPHTLATMTGGEYRNFGTEKTFERNVQRLTNRIHNYYLLSFQQASDAAPGLHKLTLKVPDYPDAKIRSRDAYYAGDEKPPEIPEEPVKKP